MKKFMYVFHTDHPIDVTDEFEAANKKWFDSLSSHLIDSGNPFNGKSEAKISNGQVTSDPDTAAGYSIIEAENLDAAVELAKSCPIANMPGCWIKIYETHAM